MALDLMPVGTEAPRCSEFARSIDVLPPGTGLFLERVVLVSVPLPWPKPALNHEILAPLTPLVKASTVTTRLFAMEPTETAGLELEVYERSQHGTLAYRWRCRSTTELQAVLRSITETAIGGLAGLVVGGGDQAVCVDPVPPTFLVCTQGSHDSCCGTSGVALADQIEGSRSEYVVRRVSHTGGHRFSPTFLALPTGRMWAFADLELVDRIAARQVTANDFANHARGWWGARVGPAQVAECAVRAERPDLLDQLATIETVASDENTSEFAVSIGDEAWRVSVRVGRTIPTIACEAPGGMPAKPGREFAWSIARQ